MNAHVVLLRGVNVGGKRKVSMAELQAALVAVGFADARTLLNSGNVVLRSPFAPAALETLLETEAHQRIGLRTDFHVRSAAEWRALIDANPLPDAAACNPSYFLTPNLMDAKLGTRGTARNWNTVLKLAALAAS